ncbi:MAG TPA: hypothetical protein VFU47_02445, partial [Armatimonadota bacterium]|nr:hypothetical protein [Armatimonadota bacterium]
MSASNPPSGDPIVVHCHLRWDGVWQRPQQIMSRLAGRHRIAFIEEPIFLAPGETPRLEVREAQPGVTVVRPHV